MLTKLFKIGFDLSQQRSDEEALLDQEHRYQDLFKQSPVGFWEEDYSQVRALVSALEQRGITNIRGHFVENPDVLREVVQSIRLNDVNEAAIAMFGARDRAELFAFHESLKMLMVESYGEVICSLAGGKRDLRYDYEAKMDSGRIAHVLTTLHVVETDDDSWARVVYLQEDVTLFRETEQALFEAREKAEWASRAKSEFLAHMSHELRTPMNAILGFNQIMIEQVFGPLGTPKYIEYTHDIKKAAEHLLQVINDILDISKIEAGQMVLEETSVDLKDLFESCISMVRGRADAGRTELVLQVPENAPCLLADERMISQIAINLLTNAVKFTPDEGEVTASMIVREDNGIDIAVADTGCGIAKDDIERILEPFGQAQRNSQLSQEGTGLGLSLSQQLSALHDANLRIESEPGTGTVVTVSFPPHRTAP